MKYCAFEWFWHKEIKRCSGNTQIWGVWQEGNQRFDLRKKKKKNTPERESFVITYGQRQRHKVTARAHFLFRGLFCKSFFSLESLPPRLDGAAAWLFSAVSEGSLAFLVLWSAEAGLGFRPPKTQEKMALMRKMPAKVANSVKSRRDPERPLTWSRMKLTAWDTGVSETGRAGTFSCTQTDMFQINHQNSINFPNACCWFYCELCLFLFYLQSSLL